MAWASIGRAGSTGNASNNTSSVGITLNGQAGSGGDVGDVLVLAFAVDNASSVNNADETAVTSVVDSASNNWIKIREITAGGGASQAGAVCSLWYTQVSAALSTANSVTINMSNNTARDAKAGIVWRFSNTTNAKIEAYDSTHIVIATSSNGNLDLATPRGEFLRFRAVAAETTVTSFTTTAGWTTIGTTRASATGAMAIFGEFRIITGTTAASNPSISAAADNASIMVALRSYQEGVFGSSGNGVASLTGAAQADSIFSSSGVGTATYGGDSFTNFSRNPTMFIVL